MTYNNTTFSIRDNVLIGEEVSIHEECINIGELILKAFKSKPDFIGQVDAITGKETSFQQMRENSVKCALWLKKLGVKRNDGVVVFTHNHMDTYIPYLASLYIGAILFVWHDNIGRYLKYYLNRKPKVIFTNVINILAILDIVKQLEISTKIVVFENESRKEEKFESIDSILNSDFSKTEIDNFSCTKLRNNRDTAVILFSCGTSGPGKINVTIPHCFFTSPSNLQIPNMLSNGVGLWIESLHWNISLLLTVRAIISYVKAVKIHKFSKLSELSYATIEENFCNIIQKFKVNWVFLKNCMCHQFIHFEYFRNYDLSSLKQLIFAGRISLNYVYYFPFELPNTSIIQAYCLPETGIISYEREKSKPGCSGCVSKNVRLVITAIDNETILEANEKGIIWCKSPCLTNGYFIFDKNTKTTYHNEWFCTYDIGYYNSNGEIYIINPFNDI